MGSILETVPEAGAEAEDVEEDVVDLNTAGKRYPARERRAPSWEWYRANLAAEPKAGEHPEPQTY